jgi:hypothetical protein
VLVGLIHTHILALHHLGNSGLDTLEQKRKEVLDRKEEEVDQRTEEAPPVLLFERQPEVIC